MTFLVDWTLSVKNLSPPGLFFVLYTFVPLFIYIQHSVIMLPTRKSMPRKNIRQLYHMQTFLIEIIIKGRKLKGCGHVSRSSGLAKIILQRHCERGKKTEEEVGRQHQGMDRHGVCQVPEGSGEQRRIEETGCEVICGAPLTPTVKG